MSQFYPIDGNFLQVQRSDVPATDFSHGMTFCIDSGRQIDYWEDFFQFAAADWTITETDAAATETLDVTQSNGALKIQNTAADNDEVNMQALCAPDIRGLNYFRARFKVSDADQVDMFIGLAETNTSVINGGGGPPSVNHVGFWLNDGSASMAVSVGTAAGVSIEFPALNGTVTDGTYVNVAFRVSLEKTEFYINEILVATLSNTNFPSVALRPTIALANGEAVAKSMTIDYIGLRGVRF